MPPSPTSYKSCQRANDRLSSTTSSVSASQSSEQEDKPARYNHSVTGQTKFQNGNRHPVPPKGTGQQRDARDSTSSVEADPAVRTESCPGTGMTQPGEVWRHSGKRNRHRKRKRRCNVTLDTVVRVCPRNPRAPVRLRRMKELSPAEKRQKVISPGSVESGVLNTSEHEVIPPLTAQSSADLEAAAQAPAEAHPGSTSHKREHL